MTKKDDHYTEEGVGFVDATRPDAVAEARKRHHLATADPEPTRDGLLTGPAHEKKYGLDRAAGSEARWRGIGVHPFENRALVEGEDGAENLPTATPLETADAKVTTANTAAPTAESK